MNVQQKNTHTRNIVCIPDLFDYKFADEHFVNDVIVPLMTL